jgi:hypothetical protein
MPERVHGCCCGASSSTATRPFSTHPETDFADVIKDASVAGFVTRPQLSASRVGGCSVRPGRCWVLACSDAVPTIRPARLQLAGISEFG